MGWKIEGDVPRNLTKYIIAVAPHTTNWDFLVGLAVRSIMRFKSDFLGYLPNSEVKKLLSKQSFDLFINASESEGVPVSIMEAMSYSIPVIAPDVGEISDIVNDSTGKLLNSEPSILNFVEAIQEIYFSEKYFNYRENALLMVKQNYNAEKNYKKFINNLDELILNE